jgi:KDO2-lipid IV(A) lauroyltransferase
MGNHLGIGLYWLSSRYRKRILSNLSLATRLSFDELSLHAMAKKVLQSMARAFLEFPKLLYEKDLRDIVTCENPEVALRLIQQGQGVVFFCAHQANWELFFLDGTSRMPGVAIGKQQKNRELYQFVLKVRTRFGGTIISPKQTMSEGVKAIKEGKFLGIVGDQGLPESSFSSDFLGAKAYSTTAPALICYRTGAPLIVATMTRSQDRYRITYSDPIYPNLDAPLKAEVHRMTSESLKLLEDSILQNPHEWLWVHNRFKLDTAQHVGHPFHHDTVLIIVESMKTVRYPMVHAIYPKARLFFYSCDPADHSHFAAEVIDPHTFEKKEYRFKCVINLTNHKRLSKHFMKLAAQKVLERDDLDRLIKQRGLNPRAMPDEKIVFAIARNPQPIYENYASSPFFC